MPYFYYRMSLQQQLHRLTVVIFLDNLSVCTCLLKDKYILETINLIEKTAHENHTDKAEIFTSEISQQKMRNCTVLTSSSKSKTLERKRCKNVG